MYTTIISNIFFSVAIFTHLRLPKTFTILMYRQPNLALLVNRSRSNSVELESLVRHTMFQEHRTFGSELYFAICGHGSHLGHVSETILTKFTFPLSKRAPFKVWP